MSTQRPRIARHSRSHISTYVPRTHGRHITRHNSQSHTTQRLARLARSSGERGEAAAMHASHPIPITRSSGERGEAAAMHASDPIPITRSSERTGQHAAARSDRIHRHVALPVATRGAMVAPRLTIPHGCNDARTAAHAGHALASGQASRGSPARAAPQHSHGHCAPPCAMPLRLVRCTPTCRG